jgi:transposase
MFQFIRQRCCGLDVHQAMVWACVLVVQPDGKIKKTKEKFSTMTKGLLQLRDWLISNDCKDVVMESTGVFWKPIYNLVEDIAEITLANARQVKGLPGRKTDVSDCEWLAQMHLCGLVRASFVPPRPIRDLRDLNRRRQKLVDTANAEKNRIQKYLEDANIKLSAVVSKIWGVSCREMIEALIAGGHTPKEMANLAHGRMRPKIPQLEEALNGKIMEHHRFLLKQSMKHIRFLEEQIADLEARIEECLQPYQQVYDCLMSVPFFDQTATVGFMAEMGVDMAPFPSAAHAASWSGTCPGNHESAGKRKHGKTRHGDKYLERLAVEVAWAAVRRKDSYLRGKFLRLAHRRGKKKAIFAIAHSIIKMVYHLVKERVPYREPEVKAPTERQKHKLVQKHLKALERLGYKVEMASPPATPEA